MSYFLCQNKYYIDQFYENKLLKCENIVIFFLKLGKTFSSMMQTCEIVTANNGQGTWLAQLVGHMISYLGVMSWKPTLGMEFT